VLGAVAAGCGAQEHANEPRPQPPTRVSVAISSRAITVRPSRIAFGPEPTQQIPQNQHAGQPPIRSKAPMNVVFVIANLTSKDEKLIVRGPEDFSTRPVVANGNESRQVELPTGDYNMIVDHLSTPPANFTVGPYRSSSQNDVLLP
jgi:hypothetical protein